MKKRPIALLVAVFWLIGVGPATKPVESLSGIEARYRGESKLARKAYRDAIAKANEERIAELNSLLSKAMKAENIDLAVEIKKKIDEAKTSSADDLKQDTRSGFFGMDGAGGKVIYLCDASGSMLSVFGNLKQNLKDSIGELYPDQEFNMIFFSDDNCFPLFKDKAQIANADNKKLALDFIDRAVCTGGTQPLPAINFALAEKPDVLYVLTDGFDQISNYNDVSNAFKKGNADGKMQVNCIFLQSDEDPKLEEFLKAIADQGHGEFKKILKSDM